MQILADHLASPVDRIGRYVYDQCPQYAVSWSYRLELLLLELQGYNADVLCLQETKVEDKLFPFSEFEDAGYHVAFYGQKSYNGVAILSKTPIDDVQYGFQTGYDSDNKRFISASIQNIRFLNVYIPQGQSIDSPKFTYKLELIRELQNELSQCYTPGTPLVLLGDINIAPDERDVVDPEKMKTVVSFLPEERQLLEELREWGLVDVFREFHEEGGLYSWWNFRTRGFEKNHGMRIDLILSTIQLSQQCQSCTIDVESRALPRPSDHAPVIAEFCY